MFTGFEADSTILYKPCIYLYIILNQGKKGINAANFFKD